MIKSEPKTGKPVGRPISDRVIVTVRLDNDIREELMKDGRGFGNRVNDLLRRALRL